MEAILAGMVEGVIVVDPQARLQLVNDAARQMLKLDERRHRAAVRRNDPAAGDRRARRRRPARDGRRKRCSCRRRATRRARSWPAPRRRPAPAAHGVILVLHDITELRRVDQIRRDFVANVSHELRTPLTAIRGYVEALSEERRERRGQAAVPRNHRAPHAADGAPGQGSAAAGAARRRPGNARRHRLRHADARRGGRRGLGRAADGARAARRDHRRARRRNRPRAIRPSCTTRCATWWPTPSPTRRRVRRSASTSTSAGGRVTIAVSRRRPGDSRRGFDARVRTVLPRRQVARARPRRHRAGARDRQAPGRAAPRPRPRREPAAKAAPGS